MNYMLLKDESPKCDWGILEYDPDKKDFRLFIRRDKKFDVYPILLNETVYKHNTFVMQPYWANMWVQERIVPPERQNITSILRSVGLREYDEFGLLRCSGGRCPQDKMYLEELSDKQAEKYAEIYNIRMNQ